jgi:hypothetical protein
MNLRRTTAVLCALMLYGNAAWAAEEKPLPKTLDGPVLADKEQEGKMPPPAFIYTNSSKPPQPGGEGFRPPDHVTQGTAKTNLDSQQTITGRTFVSSSDDENALRVTGANVVLKGVTIDKRAGASSTTEGGDFYGLNAALLATDGAQVVIEASTIDSSTVNGNALFSYGKGTSVTAKNLVIRTTGRNSGGLQTTGGGQTIAENTSVHTTGDSSAAIRSDRGGGTVRVTGGTFQTAGYGSPAIYSTADIAVSNAVLSAENSEGAVIEGKNRISLKDCLLNCSMAPTRLMGKTTIQEENVHGIMIYQSMSGDAEEGKSSFSMEGGSLRVQRGDVIYVTNTDCTIDLDHVDIWKKYASAALLRVVGNSATRGWGRAGENGGHAEVTARNQVLNGDIVVDTVSRLDLTLDKGSTFTGAARIESNTAGQNGNHAFHMIINKGAVWNLTGDSTVTTLQNNGTIHRNGHKLVVLEA